MPVLIEVARDFAEACGAMRLYETSRKHLRVLPSQIGQRLSDGDVCRIT